MLHTIKILKIKDPIIAKNGLRLLAILYKFNHKDLIDNFKDGIFLTTRTGAVNWDTDDIVNIKTFLEDSLELEFKEVLEAA